MVSHLVAQDGSSVMTVLVAGGDAMQRGAVNAALAALEEPTVSVLETDTHDGAQKCTAEERRADVVMVVVGADRDEAISRLEAEDGRKQRRALFAWLSEPNECLVRRVLNAGADEVLVLPPERDALMSALLKVSERRRRSQGGERARVCSLTSVTGGVGVTTLSANLGMALRRATGGRVALIDLDLQQGGLSALLNVAPDRTIMPLAGAAEKLNSITLESALSRHASGLYLLAAPKRIEDSERVTDLTVGAVVDLMSGLFDYVVIDCGRHIDENAVAAWERSTEVLYVLEQSARAGRCALRFLELFARLRIGCEPRLVLNRYNPRHPITEAQIGATLRRPIYARVPNDEQLLEKSAALLKSPWQLAPRSALVAAYEVLAATLSGERDSGSYNAPGLVTRLLAALGTRV